jgi:hypothetical protein
MLGFLVPKLAWLALTALAPVAIHLLNRIRLRRVPFSSLLFLREVKRERFNWLRLKEILLLIARAALLLFLFLGLSRPFLKSGLFGIKREASTVVIVDDSYSMRYGGNTDCALAGAKAYLAQFTGTSEGAVMTSSNPQATFLTRDVRRLTALIDSLPATYSGADLTAAVEQARNLLANATLPQREIAIFTDLQKRAIAPVRPSPDKRVATLVKDCGSLDWRNAAITSVATSEPLPQPGKPTGLVATVRNFGNHEETRTAALSVDGGTETKTFALPAGAEKTVEFDRQLIDPGEHTGSILLDRDSLACDDQRYFALNVPSRLPVLLVGDVNDDLTFLSRALAPESLGFFEVTTRLVSNLRTADLRRFRVVALVNPWMMTSFDWQRVDEYLRQGGAVFIALGREPKDKTFLNRFCTWLGESRPSGFVTIGKADYNHPVLEAFKERTDLSAPRFFRYARVLPADATVLLRLSDNNPYLIESKSDRVIIASGDFRLEDTDLPFKALFVPLMHRIFSFLGREQPGRSYVIGDTVNVPAPTVGLLKVKTPESEYSLTPQSAGSIGFGDTRVPGIYQLGDRSYAVNVLTEEGDLTRISEAELGQKGFSLLKDVRGKTSDLTNLFLIIAGLCLIAEMVLLVV